VINGDVSFWYRETGLPVARESLQGRVDADVCIVGAGFTGLWTAYYLKQAEPSLRIAILEQQFSGFGASGRNGGWLSGLMPGLRQRYEKAHGRDPVLAMQAQLNTTVDEVIAIADREGIEADIVKGGMMQVARSRAQLERLRESVAEEHRWGVTDCIELSAEETVARIQIRSALGGLYLPQCARIQPAKLVQGLVRAVEASGVRIYENTRVSEIRPGMAISTRGSVHARYVLRATEGFTAGIRGLRRSWLPMNSSIIVTEPLSPEQWAGIGWESCETLGDCAHAYIYAQRTADGRIALGGRGVPYRFGSRTDSDGRTQAKTVVALRSILTSMFPGLGTVDIDHAWSGVLGVPRDWCATVGLDMKSGIGWAGGYVGNGVSGTNLAGRTLRDLVLERDSDLVALPWVNRQVRPWEPEPLRWLGVLSLYGAYRYADRREQRRGSSTSVVAQIADKISGRH
jgi:glycine/D-amino acid oxidase-like deaminating enzyme